MERNTALDITKGIGILLVIFGHFPDLPHWAWKFIFSFHMPLFFIIAGYLYKPRGIKEMILKDFKRLMIPYFLTCAVIIVFYFLYWVKSNDSSLFKYYLIASLVGNGSNNHDCIFLGDLPSIGAIWFLPALYACKNVYNAIRTDKRFLYSSILFVVSALLGRYLIFIPFSFLSGLSAIIFFAIGDKLKSWSKIPPFMCILGGICWIVSLSFSTISIARPRIDLYFIDVIGATTASLLVYYLSTLLQRLKTISTSLAWIGKNSLIILCFHLIDLDCDLSERLTIVGAQGYKNLLCIFLPIVGTILFNYSYRMVSICSTSNH